jgi:hypothetical protein
MKEEVLGEPITMNTGVMNREGGISLNFSEPLHVPDLVKTTDASGNRRLYIQNFKNHPVTGRRQLIGVSQLDVSRDILDFDFVTESDDEANKIGYYLEMKDWKAKSMEIHVNYTEPLEIGYGND